MNELNLQQVNQHIVIGVVLDEHLEWREQEDLLNYGVVPTYKAVFTPMVADTILQLVINASPRVVHYCLGDCSNVARLEKLQKQAARIILGPSL